MGIGSTLPVAAMDSSAPEIHRILVIDDNPAIHDDFRKVLAHGDEDREHALAAMESALFADAADVPIAPHSSAADTTANSAAGAGTSGRAVRFSVDAAGQGEPGVAMCEAALAAGKPYAVAFVDMRMPPGWDGVRTIRELWKVAPDLQVVVCTAYSDYSPGQIADELGISDQLLLLRKPFDGIEVRQLATTLARKWQTAAKQAQLERLIAARTTELQRAALYDALTGLPNRAMFNDRLNLALRRAQRDSSYGLAVLFIDSDSFKVINDSLGHHAGDLLLLEIAERLAHAVHSLDGVLRTAGPAQDGVGRPVPLAARLGGDEFGVLLDGIIDDGEAVAISQRLATELARPYTLNGQTVHNTVSIGITTSRSNAYAAAGEMLRDADTAMYRAKREGRCRVAVFDQRMHTEAMTRLTLEADLHAAVERDEIQLHYQPIIELRSRELTGFEALARWHHPQHGWIAPATFIPLAEETGVILPLGQRLLSQACRQLAAWQTIRAPSAAVPSLTVSVNVSRRQLVAPDFAGRVAQTLAEAGIAPGVLKLEITESTIMGDPQAAHWALRELRRLGVGVHMDDFGTGYSSLSCLRQLPLSGLKIDRGFVSDLTRASTQAAITRAIVYLAHSLELPLVAEGVETWDQLHALDSMGCDQIQGFLLGKPMDAAAAARFIQNHVAKRDAA